MNEIPDWFAKKSHRFLGHIRENTEDIQNDSFHLCIYDGEIPIDVSAVMKVARLMEEAMLFFTSKTGFCSYAWFDHQSGQLRVSTKKDADVQGKFGSKIVFVYKIEELIMPIYQEEYEDKDFDLKNWKTRVFSSIKNEEVVVDQVLNFTPTP